MERERRNGGKEPKRTGSPARPRTVQPASQPIEFESRSTSWQTVPNAVLVPRCHVAVTPDISTRKEKARCGQERERDRKKEREKERRVQLKHCISCPLVTFMIRVKQRFSPVLLASVRPFFSVFFPLFYTFSLFFFFALFFLPCTSCYTRFVNSCFFTGTSRDL